METEDEILRREAMEELNQFIEGATQSLSLIMMMGGLPKTREYLNRKHKHKEGE